MFNFIKKQFIDVIQWPNPDDSLLMWRFPIADEEIQNGASLTVREAQMAMFVDEGVTADVFGPGRYTLNTQTLPLLTNLKNWDKLFESPFKSDVYFFNTKQQLARKWGTSQPVTVRDAEFGAVQLRSFGMYAYRISDPAKFFKEVSGVAAEYSGAELETQLRNIAVTQLAAAFGSSGIPFLDMAANQVLLSQKIGELLGAEFAKLGLTLETSPSKASLCLPPSKKPWIRKFPWASSAIWDATPNTKPPNPSRSPRKTKAGLPESAQAWAWAQASVRQWLARWRV